MHVVEGLTSKTAGRRAVGMTLTLCVLASLADGFDLQSTGITAIQFAEELGLDTSGLSWVFAANSLGLFMGATLGGWLADRIGRRPVMIGSMVFFGVFSIATALVSSGTYLAEIRFLTGLGLGAALANIIALVAEFAPVATRSTRVMLITASNPLGGAIPGMIMTSYPDLDWRTIFQIGGWWPLLIAGAMLPWLAESPLFDRNANRGHKATSAESRTVAYALFGEKRARITLSLWVGFFFCVLAMYLIINWLPSLLVEQGYSAREARMAALAFPLGGTFGTVALGLLVRSTASRLVAIAAFAGILVSVAGLALAPHDPAFVFVAAFATGFFVIGTQFLLYGLSPTYYPASVRGTGVGVAVAVGRLGSIAGPVLAGVLIGAGHSASQVLLSLFPGVLLAFVATLALTWMSPIADDHAPRNT